MISAQEHLYRFADRYRMALKKNYLLSYEDKPLLSELVNLCIPYIPANLHPEIFTKTCCFAVVKKPDKSFEIHVAFMNHDLIVKFRMEAPRDGTCSFYKVKEDSMPKHMNVSKLVDDIAHEAEEEEWYIVSAKERDALMMPPPPPRKVCKTESK